MTYVGGAPDPFPLPAASGTYTPGIYAIIEWDDGTIPASVYSDLLLVTAAVTPKLAVDIFAPALETLLVAATALTTMAAEQYNPVTGTYADDLTVAVTASGSLSTETFLSESRVTLTALATPILADEAVGLAEIVTVPVASTLRLAAEVYAPQFGETLQVNATATPSLSHEEVGAIPVSDIPDLEAVVRCYTLGVDIDLVPVDAISRIFAPAPVVKV